MHVSVIRAQPCLDSGIVIHERRGVAVTRVLMGQRGTARWTGAVALALMCAGCIDQEQALFELNAPPEDMGPGGEMCVPATCEPGACGAQLDGCGEVLDCGPCSSARCPATFEVLFSNVLAPNLLQYDPARDALMFVSERGSNPLSQWNIGDWVPGTPPESVKLRQRGSTARYRLASSATYLGNNQGTTWRLLRNAEDPGQRQEVLGFDSVGMSSLGDDVWVSVLEPSRLLRFSSPMTEPTLSVALDAAPVDDLIAVGPEHVWWAERQPEGGMNLRTLTRSADALALPSTVWSTEVDITTLIAREQGVCAAVEGDSSTTLWLSLIHISEPTRPY